MKGTRNRAKTRDDNVDDVDDFMKILGYYCLSVIREKT